jgi:hypothetical protein
VEPDMKTLLILGVIALFIGLAFIPSFNAVSISKDNEETNPLVDDIEEDCGCKDENKNTDLVDIDKSSFRCIFLEIYLEMMMPLSEKFPIFKQIVTQIFWLGVGWECWDY